jgi:hypothetical protein
MIERIKNYEVTVANFKEIAEALIERKGFRELMTHLETKTDFFTAPCSTIYHFNIEGGLVLHSLNLFFIMERLVEIYGEFAPRESRAIVSLFHDVCKTNYYIKTYKNVKKDGKWREEEVWSVEDQFPVGHGEKSVIFLQQFMLLTTDEILAIRWHMSSFDPGVLFNYPSGYAFNRAMESCKLLNALIVADTEATYFLEGGK